MQWIALALALTIVVVVVTAVMVPMRLALSVKGHGEFGKFWAFAFGGQLWFITASYADALGIDSIFQVYVFNRRIIHRSPAIKRVTVKSGEREPTLKDSGEEVPGWRGKVERWFDMGDLLVFVVGLRRYIRMERFKSRLSYATPDVALTGMLSGSLYTLAGLLAPFGTLQVEPQWVDVTKAAGNLDVALRFNPTRMLLYAIVFATKNIKLRQRTRPRAVAAQS